MISFFGVIAYLSVCLSLLSFLLLLCTCEVQIHSKPHPNIHTRFVKEWVSEKLRNKKLHKILQGYEFVIVNLCNEIHRQWNNKRSIEQTRDKYKQKLEKWALYAFRPRKNKSKNSNKQSKKYNRRKQEIKKKMYDYLIVMNEQYGDNDDLLKDVVMKCVRKNETVEKATMEFHFKKLAKMQRDEIYNIDFNYDRALTAEFKRLILGLSVKQSEQWKFTVCIRTSLFCLSTFFEYFIL